MPESPLADLTIEGTRPPRSGKKSGRSRRRRRKPISGRVWTLLILAIIVLGCANVTALWVLWASIRHEELVDHVSAATAESLSLPEPRRTLEPTPTATRVVIYVPTSTSTPTATPTQLPTATQPPVAAPAPIATPTPTPESITHVIIISIDGLRPDALARADTPTLDNFLARGAYSPSAQTVRISETLPSHAAMLGGMTPEKNGVLWGLPYIGWPGINGPTLFSVAHETGLSTAMVFGKEKLNYLILPNSVDKVFGADVHDLEVKNEAVKFIEAGLPNVLFIHLPDTDRVGHLYGWMSDHQLQAVTFADSMIGEITAALDRGGYLNSTLLIVTADHGGHGKGHGDDSPEDRTIPWLAVGPGVAEGSTITRPINTYDTAATALYALGLPVPEGWDGRPVAEIFK